MITRIWRGWTSPANAQAHQTLIETEIFPGIIARDVKGFLGITLLSRELADEVEFATVMWFDSLASVKAFAGEDYETAVVPPKALAVLSRFEARSAHYETPVPPTLSHS
jgi:heme-degrading monooxygenase HmoA